MSESKKSLKDAVLDRIRAGHTTMRPRWHFILKTSLIVVGGVFVLLTTLFLVSFLFFVLARAGVWFLPPFGLHSMRLFLWSLPWVLVLVAILFCIILELFVQRSSFAYRRPVLFSVALIVVVVLFASMAIARTSFHGRMMRRAEMHHVPGAERLYGRYRPEHFRSLRPSPERDRRSERFQETPW